MIVCIYNIYMYDCVYIYMIVYINIDNLHDHLIFVIGDIAYISGLNILRQRHHCSCRPGDAAALEIAVCSL